MLQGVGCWLQVVQEAAGASCGTSGTNPAALCQAVAYLVVSLPTTPSCQQVAALTCLLRQLLHPAPGPLPHLGRMHLLLFGCACAARILRRSPAGPDVPWALLRVLGLLHGAWLLQW